MILERVNSPRDLKALKIDELKSLSHEIRDLIIKVVSCNGGHLASSLGAVELCIGLHYCLDTPEDSLIFDVGHQTYAHKILTERKEAFSTLRQHKGISGFPNFNESVYDVYISGHASTSISWAQGLAEAKRIKQDGSKTIAIIGDGSLTGGMSFEALNSCGHSQSNVLVILNHNEMSISLSVGALSKYLTKIISAPIYNKIKNELESFTEHFSLGKKLTKKAKKLEETLKGLVLPGIFFEELGFRYFGPIDGHNLDILIPTIKNIASLKGPRLLHIVTKKGKGYELAENYPQNFHGVSSFDVDTGKPQAQVADTFSKVFAKKLESLAQSNQKITAITAAMPEGTGLEEFSRKFPERFFDVGIAESHAVGLASGLAKKGLKPVVAIYSTFLQRSFDQIIHDVALQNLGVVFAVDRAGVVGQDGPTHHGVFDVGYLRMIPGMVCMAPKDTQELQDMLEYACGIDLPTAIRYPKGQAYSLGYKEQIKLGKAQVLKNGNDICLVALGSMVKIGLEAVLKLQQEDINISLINARFIKPLDGDLFRQLANKFRAIVILEEAALSCGFGSAVLEFYEKEGLLSKSKIIRMGFEDEFIPAAERSELLRIYGLSAQQVADKIKKVLKEV